MILFNEFLLSNGTTRNVWPRSIVFGFRVPDQYVEATDLNVETRQMFENFKKSNPTSFFFREPIDLTMTLHY
jgi:hypothetical protein